MLVRFYVAFVTIGLTISVLLNIFLGGVPAWPAVLYTFIGLGALAMLSVLSLSIQWLLPKSCFDPERKYYRTLKWEKKFYRFIRVKSWKALVPDAGGKVSNFPKKSIANPNDAEYLHRFLVETCSGEVVHTVCLFVGFLILLIPPYFFIMLPVTILNFILHLMPIMIQRYIRPRLLEVYKRRGRKVPALQAEQATVASGAADMPGPAAVAVIKNDFCTGEDITDESSDSM